MNAPTDDVMLSGVIDSDGTIHADSPEDWPEPRWRPREWFVDGRRAEISELGACPRCHRPGTLLHLHKDQYLYCAAHRVRWYIGYGLFSTPLQAGVIQEHEYAAYHREEKIQFGRLQPVRPSWWQWSDAEAAA